ncbi:MAG: hypothetical protein JNK63_00065 [Chthonomonas sp.]|nr:hypothetical protein [Chthonomonas sp.]
MRGFCPFLVLASATAAHAVVHVNFDSMVNSRLSTLTGGSGYPPNGGMFTIAGIEHRIAVNTLNQSSCMFVTNETKIIPVNVFGVTEVYPSINSGYGSIGQLNGRVEVHGSGGLLHTYVLTQGDNIRDHYNGNYNNIAPNVNGTHVMGTGVRFDQQKIVLPAAFHGAVLTEVRLVGQNNNGLNGSPMIQSLSLVQAPGQTVVGTLELNDTVANFAFGRSFQYVISQGTTVVATGGVVAQFSTQGYAFQIPAAFTGPATITFDGLTHVRKGFPITLTGSGVSVGTTPLQNGDADASGEVDAADIDLVIADFGSTSVGPADLDVSGEVDAADIDIAIANFGATDE